MTTTTATLNRAYEQCHCWRCRGLNPNAKERAWMLQLLARQLLRAPMSRRLVWLADYGQRHGHEALREVRRAMDLEADDTVSVRFSTAEGA